MEGKSRPLFIISEVRRHPIAANEEPAEAGSLRAEGGTIDTKLSEGVRVAG